MTRKLLTYLWLFIFSAQAVIASVDIHSFDGNSSTTDIVHHFIDKHTQGITCEAGEYPEHSDEDSHHGCSGHVTSLNNHYFESINTSVIQSRVTIDYYVNIFSIIPPPLFKPPILS